MTPLNMTGPNSQNFPELIIPWMSNAVLTLALATRCVLRSEPLTHVNSYGAATLITHTSVRPRRGPHSTGLSVLLASGAIKDTACGRMLTSKSKMATGGRGPNLAPVLGRVEPVFVLEHANAIIPRPSMVGRTALVLILSTSFVIQKNAKSTLRTSGPNSANSVTHTLTTRIPNTTGCRMNIPTPRKDAIFTVSPKRLGMLLT